MLFAADFRRKGREALAGKWGSAVGVGFVASLLGAATTFAGVGGGGGRSTENAANLENTADMGEMTGVLDFSSIDSIADLNGIIPTEFQVGFLTLISFLGFMVLARTAAFAIENSA